jgi:phage terminase large subunit
MTGSVSPARLERFGAELDALIAAHEGARRDFTRYRTEPPLNGFLAFCREELKVSYLWSKQRALAETFLTHPLTVAVSGNAAGKDYLAACLMLFEVHVHGAKILLMSGGEQQVADISMSKVAALWHGGLGTDLYRMSLRVPGNEDAGIVARAGSELSTLTGYHAPRLIVVLSEAQGLGDHVWEAVSAWMPDKVLCLGNPVSADGRFYQITRPTSGWAVVQISCLAHPNLTHAEPVIPGGPTEAKIARIAHQWGAGSAYYRAHVLGEFPEGSEEGLIRARSWLERAAARAAVAPLPSAHAQPIVACDVARYGSAQTAVAVLSDRVVRELVTWADRDLIDTAQRVIDVAHHWGVRRGLGPAQPGWGWMVIDVVGVGSGVADLLRRHGYKTCDFAGSEKAISEGPGGIAFANKRTESYWALRTALERGTLGLPNDETLFDELMSLRWRPSASGGKVELESKADWSRRVGRSCDKSDAVAMAVYQTVDDEMYRAVHELNASGRAFW